MGKKEAGLFDLAHDFAEKRIDEHGALGEHAPELKHLADGEDDGDGDEGADDADQDGDEERGHGREEERGGEGPRAKDQ